MVLARDGQRPAVAMTLQVGDVRAIASLAPPRGSAHQLTEARWLRQTRIVSTQASPHSVPAEQGARESRASLEGAA